MKKFKLFFALFAMLALGVTNAWGDVTCDFTAKSASHSVYTDSWSYGDFTVFGGANSNGQWAYVKMGGKSANLASANPVYIASPKMTSSISKVQVSIYAGSLPKTGMSVNSWGVYVYSDENMTTQIDYVAGGTIDKNAKVFEFTPSEGTVWAANNYYKVSFDLKNTTTTNGIIWVDKVTFVESTSGGGTETAVCSTPTFSPAAGAVVSGTTVELNTTTEGATIHYTKNGVDPTTSDATYSTPIEITSETTIKAIAVKDGYDNSEVASASYTIVTPYNSIASLADAMTNSDQSVYVTFGGWQVSVVKNNQAFVTDGTNGLIIYQRGHGLVEGDILTGTVQCTLVSYNGVVELKGVTKTMDGIDVNSGTISPVVKTIAEANDLTALNTGLLIKLENVTYNGTAFVDAGSNTIAPYNTFYSYSLTSGQKYNVTGIVQQFQSKSQIYPRKAEDIEALTTIATPTISPDPSVTYTEAQNISITCSTDGAKIYYTTDGTDPKTSGTKSEYSAPFQLSDNATVKAIANKGEDWSEIATAAYIINIPLPSHVFQYTHYFTTGEGFVFPEGWSNSYGEHEIVYTDDKVVFASGSKQTSTITDRPVVKNTAVSLVLTNSAKMITAVRFDYKQWGTNAQTFTMTYSTDGGTSYSAFDPAVTGSNFAIQALVLPEGVNAIRVIGSKDKQAGLTSIAFDLEDKPIVTKTVTITPPSHGTLVVKNAGVAIASGDAIEVGTTLTIEATPDEGYSLSEVTVNGNAYTEATLTLTENVTIAATFVEDVRPEASLTLWENGNEVAYPGNYKQNDHVTLPTTVSHECVGRVFVGWSAVEVEQTDIKPAYLEPGADFILSAAGVNTLYAVYAVEGAATSDYKLSTQAPAAGETVIISRLVESTYYALTNTATPASAKLTLNAGVVENPNDDVLWDVEAATDGVYLRPTDSTNGLHMNSSELKVANGDTNGDIKFTANGDGSFKATRADGARWIVVSGTNSFTCSSTESNAVALYIFKAIHNYSKYSTTCAAAIDAPIFDVAAGTYQDAQLVLIDNYDGNYIYVYTTDDSDPTLDSNLDPEGTGVLYNNDEGIEINASCTLKARAYDIDGNYSDVTSAAYTINLPVDPEVPTLSDAVYQKVTSAPADWSGEYILVYEQKNETDCYVWNGKDESNGYIAATRNNDIISGAFATITIAPMTDGYSVRVNGGDKSGMYIGGVSNSNTISYSAEAILNTIEFSEVGIDLTSNTSVMRFNTSSNTLRFRYYKSGQSAVQLYKKLVYTREVTSGNFGTICLPFGSANYSGATFYEFVGSETGKVYLGSVTTLKAGVPYIFEASANELAVYSNGTTTNNAGNKNGLHGTFVNDTEVAVGNYILKDNKLCQATGICYVNANRAYIVMSEVPNGKPNKVAGRRYIGMSVQGENETTGVEDLFTIDAPVKVIENGQLIIIREGVKYNVQGQKL